MGWFVKNNLGSAIDHISTVYSLIRSDVQAVVGILGGDDGGHGNLGFGNGFSR